VVATAVSLFRSTSSTNVRPGPLVERLNALSLVCRIAGALTAHGSGVSASSGARKSYRWTRFQCRAPLARTGYHGPPPPRGPPRAVASFSVAGRFSAPPYCHFTLMLARGCRRLFSQPLDIPRTHISLVGFMNAGKSSVMNALTQQPTSIVDATPGTTADTKIALKEIHSIGPCKLLDTAGVDESGSLGLKKLAKTASAIKESDIVLFVVDPANFKAAPFRDVVSLVVRRGKTAALVLNQFGPAGSGAGPGGRAAAAALAGLAGAALPEITVRAVDAAATHDALVAFIARLRKKESAPPLIPLRFVGKDRTVLLNIPLDVESPSGRLIRPQSMVLEFALRRYSPVSAFCMDLAAGRSADPSAERARFLKCVTASAPSLVITDSQAIDLVHAWTPPDVPLTTFSVAMANVQSGGRIGVFSRGIDALANLRSGDRVLICEACNHDRIGDDIGTVKLPAMLKKRFPGVELDWAFGRSYENKKLAEYSLALHCGGCMISGQQMVARVQDLLESGVPIANYGLALSWLASPEALDRVLKPWQ